MGLPGVQVGVTDGGLFLFFFPVGSGSSLPDLLRGAEQAPEHDAAEQGGAKVALVV